MDEPTYDFGEVFGQNRATFESVRIYLANELGVQEPDLSIMMDNLYPNVEEVATNMLTRYDSVAGGL